MDTSSQPPISTAVNCHYPIKASGSPRTLQWTEEERAGPFFNLQTSSLSKGGTIRLASIYSVTTDLSFKVSFCLGHKDLLYFHFLCTPPSWKSAHFTKVLFSYTVLFFLILTMGVCGQHVSFPILCPGASHSAETTVGLQSMFSEWDRATHISLLATLLS
jgi:hypothetical protein